MTSPCGKFTTIRCAAWGRRRPNSVTGVFPPKTSFRPRVPRGFFLCPLRIGGRRAGRGRRGGGTAFSDVWFFFFTRFPAVDFLFTVLRLPVCGKSRWGDDGGFSCGEFSGSEDGGCPAAPRGFCFATSFWTCRGLVPLSLSCDRHRANSKLSDPVKVGTAVPARLWVSSLFRASGRSSPARFRRAESEKWGGVQ